MDSDRVEMIVRPYRFEVSPSKKLKGKQFMRRDLLVHVCFLCYPRHHVLLAFSATSS